MKRFTPKKRIILPILAAASLGMSSFALANNNPANVGVNNGAGPLGIAAAIQDLGNKMVALGFAGMTAFDQAMYQFDQNLVTISNANTAAVLVNQNNKDLSAKATSHYIQNAFQNISDSFASTAEDAINAKAIQNQIEEQGQLVNNLTLGVPASDTLYINQPSVIAAGYGSFTPTITHYYNTKTAYTIGPASINDNKYFSVSSILQPLAYTPSGVNAVNAYMAYLTQSYDNPASALKLSELKGYINTLKPNQQSAALYHFVSSTQYQKYQLALRSYMANKSVAIANFQHLIAERTPSKNKVAGIYNSKGKAIPNPSPLQVQQYQANHRIDNPAWIHSLQSKSSASLQREIAIELAQMIKQNQQAHQDRERILTTLSALQLQGSLANKMALQTLAQQVNQEITSLGGNANAKNKAAKNARQRAEAAIKKAQEEGQTK